MKNNNRKIIFLIMFLVGFYGLLYEVIFLTLAEVVIGAKAMSTSFVLALFLMGLAVGALTGGNLSKRNIIHPQILFWTNLASSLAGFIALFIFKHSFSYLVAIASGTFFIFIIPFLNGLSIPIAVRILEGYGQKNETGFIYFSNTLGSVLGALIAGAVLIPRLGFHGAMFFSALLGLCAAIISVSLNQRNRFFFALILLLLSFPFLFLHQKRLQLADLRFFEKIYFGGIQWNGQARTPLLSWASPYQHILVAESSEFGRQLYLNGGIQVSESDSEKYHQYLILPAIAAHPNPKRILIIGEGDGGGLFQVLKYPFEVIDHVELDETVINVSRQYLDKIQHGALDNPRIKRYIQDGRRFIHNAPKNYYDIIVLAFPDPYTLRLATL